ncbi:MAG: TonB-dependent receptor [Cyclobacteriaceae bacterium]
MSRYTICGIILQSVLAGMLIASDGNAQTNKGIGDVFLSLELKNETLRHVFEQITEQTDFKFAYEEGRLGINKKISLEASNMSLKNILMGISKKNKLSFRRVGDQIFVVKLSGPPVVEELSLISADVNVSGKITDENGEGLPGASVVLKGTANGTTTNIEGDYKITVPDNATLVVSFVGYKTTEIELAGRSVIDVEMQLDAEQLEEVVVMGYGAQTKNKVTGAVSTISTEDISKVSYANSTGVIQGRVAGVRVESNGGQPGAGINVVIRGTGTFGNDQPLYIVDGNIVGSIDYLNPNDIQDFSVLKDASAAAIYGSRAANGVVLITTKSGKVGDLKINLEIKRGVQSPTNTLDFLNAREYADYHNMARDNDGDARAVPNDTGFNPNIDTDWQDLSINQALYEDYSFNASGGSESGTYYISGQYVGQEGIVVDSDFKRYNITANTRFAKGKFALNENLSISRQISNPNTFYGRERGEIPTIEVYDENNEGGFAGIEPNLHGLARGINWYGRAILNDNKITTDRIVASIAPQFEIIEGLTYKLNLGLNYSLLHNYNFEPTFFLSTSQEASNDLARLDERYTRSVGTLIENTLNYTKSINDSHNFDVLVGFTKQENEARMVGGIGTDFNFNTFRVLGAANDNTDVDGSLNESALVSYLGRINYDFESKYLISATIRRDGSSRFIEENRWGVFPAFSLGWIASKEGFFASETINLLKLRASYGELGSQNIGNYETSSVLNINNFYNLGGQVLGGGTVRALANPGLIWETSKTSNLAIDAQLFDSRVSLTLEYFDKKSENILANVPIPTSGGLGSSLRNNAASIQNKGFEFLGTYTSAAKPDGLNYNVSVNFTSIKNEVLALGDGVNPISGGGFTQQGFQATRTDVGYAVGSFYGYLVEGLYQTNEQIAADGRTGTAQLGDMNFLDLNGDDAIDDLDRDYMGSPIPSFEFGINFGATYKKFDFNLFIQGVQGNELWNAKKFQHILDGAGGNKIREVQNAWTPSNTNTDIPRMTIRDANGNKRSSDFFVEDGSYIRFKTIQIGYTLPQSIVEKASMSSVRFYFSAQNLLTFTSYTGYDPEIGRSLDGGLFGGGVDRRAYPQAKNLILGVQVSF